MYRRPSADGPPDSRQDLGAKLVLQAEIVPRSGLPQGRLLYARQDIIAKHNCQAAPRRLDTPSGRTLRSDFRNLAVSQRLDCASCPKSVSSRSFGTQRSVPSPNPTLEAGLASFGSHALEAPIPARLSKPDAMGHDGGGCQLPNLSFLCFFNVSHPGWGPASSRIDCCLRRSTADGLCIRSNSETDD